MGRRAKTRLAWLLAAIWGSFIWGLGSDGFSMTSTSRFLGPLVNWAFADWALEHQQDLLTVIRKLAHVAEYAMFALLVGRAITLAFEIRMRFVIAGTLVAALALAAGDEFRQALSPQRTGTAFDVALDVSGALVALVGLFALRRWVGRPMFDTSASSRA